jgi:hypothetical protein
MYGMMIQMIDVYVCIAPEDDPQMGSKHILGKNKVLLIPNSRKKDKM